MTRAEADEARALAEAAQSTPRLQATTRFGVGTQLKLCMQAPASSLECII